MVKRAGPISQNDTNNKLRLRSQSYARYSFFYRKAVPTADAEHVLMA